MKSFRLSRLTLLAAVFTAVPALAQDAGDKVVARVGSSEIRMSDVDFATSLLGDPAPNASAEAKMSTVVDALIDLRVVSDAARADGLEDDPAFKQQMAFVKQQALRSSYLSKAAAKAVSETAVRKVYDERVATIPVVKEVRIRHILFKDKANAQKAAAAISNGKSFDVMAQTISEDAASKAKGGDLGFMPVDQLPPEIAAVVTDMKVGEVWAAPVETPFGFHLIKLDERRDRTPPAFQTVSSEIRKSLEAREIGRIVAELKAKSKIEKLVPDVAAPQQGGDGHPHTNEAGPKP